MSFFVYLLLSTKKETKKDIIYYSYIIFKYFYIKILKDNRITYNDCHNLLFIKV